MDSSDLVSGQIAGGWAFDGDSQYAVSAKDVGGGTEVAIFAWITSRETTDGGWVFIGTSGTSADVYTGIRRDTSTAARAIIGDGAKGKYRESPKDVLPVDTRCHVVMTASVGEFPDVYVNGTLNNGASKGGSDPDAVGTGKLYLGTGVKNNAFVDLDEIQVFSSIPRAAWIAYEYGITSNPADFWNNSGWTSLATGSSIAAIAAYYRRMRA